MLQLNALLASVVVCNANVDVFLADTQPSASARARADAQLDAFLDGGRRLEVASSQSTWGYTPNTYEYALDSCTDPDGNTPAACGPSNWETLFPQCGQENTQSPVNLAPAEADSLLSAVSPSQEVCNSTDTCVGGKVTKLEWNGDTFVLQQIDLHVPSEHTVAHGHFDAEMQHEFVNAEGDSLVLSIFLQSATFQNPLFGTIWPASINAASSVNNVSDTNSDLSQGLLMPASTSYYTYNGSLTRPGCDVNTTWVIMEQSVFVGAAQLAGVRSAINAVGSNINDLVQSAEQRNNRPLQALGARVIGKFEDSFSLVSLKERLQQLIESGELTTQMLTGNLQAIAISGLVFAVVAFAMVAAVFGKAMCSKKDSKTKVSAVQDVGAAKVPAMPQAPSVPTPSMPQMPTPAMPPQPNMPAMPPMQAAQPAAPAGGMPMGGMPMQQQPRPMPGMQPAGGMQPGGIPQGPGMMTPQQFAAMQRAIQAKQMGAAPGMGAPPLGAPAGMAGPGMGNPQQPLPPIQNAPQYNPNMQM